MEILPDLGGGQCPAYKWLCIVETRQNSKVVTRFEESQYLGEDKQTDSGARNAGGIIGLGFLLGNMHNPHGIVHLDIIIYCTWR